MKYEEIIVAIDEAPLTQLGGLMVHTIKACLKRSFFKNHEALLKAVKVVIAKGVD